MIWSSRARNRSPDLVVSCFFGRIAVPPLHQPKRENHDFRFEGILKMRLQGSEAPNPKTLQSRMRPRTEKRILINGLAVVHRRPFSQWSNRLVNTPLSRPPTLTRSPSLGRN